jgi:hypothetical protein
MMLPMLSQLLDGVLLALPALLLVPVQLLMPHNWCC